MDAKQVIYERSSPVPESGCWLWEGSTGSHGYGDIRIHYKLHLAHRLSYEAFVGPIPDGMFVMHKCDVRSCVNPDHLSIGTHQQNMADKCDKGRWAGQGPRKLTLSDAIKIRRLRAEGAKAKEIAKLYDLHPDHIRKITSFKIWKVEAL